MLVGDSSSYFEVLAPPTCLISSLVRPRDLSPARRLRWQPLKYPPTRQRLQQPSPHYPLNPPASPMPTSDSILSLSPPIILLLHRHHRPHPNPTPPTSRLWPTLKFPMSPWMPTALIEVLKLCARSTALR